jgi:hypothetical protein
VLGRGEGLGAYEAEARVEGLGEDGVRGVEDELREEDLVFAFVDLGIVSWVLGMHNCRGFSP